METHPRGKVQLIENPRDLTAFGGIATGSPLLTFSHPDCTVGSGLERTCRLHQIGRLSGSRAWQALTCPTAGRELHPAPKMMYFFVTRHYTQFGPPVKLTRTPVACG